MSDQSAVPREAHLPGQEFEALDLDPKIDPEPDQHRESDDAQLSRPDAADNPELGNTLIDPGNS